MSTTKYTDALTLFNKYKLLFIKISNKYPEKYREDLIQEAFLFCDNIVKKGKRVGFRYLEVGFNRVCSKYKMSKEGIKSYKSNGHNSRTMIQLKEVELEKIGEQEFTEEFDTDWIDMQLISKTNEEMKKLLEGES